MNDDGRPSGALVGTLLLQAWTGTTMMWRAHPFHSTLLFIPALFTAALVPLLNAKPVMATPMMSRIAVVTGSNKGIGFAIARKLAQTEGHICVLTARDESRGQKAAQDLRREEGIADDAVVYKQLDIGDPASVERFAAEMEQEYGRCDILVNNAAIAFEFNNAVRIPLKQQVEDTLRTNFFDTVAFTEKMLPLVRKSKDGRIVNMASMTGHLRILSSNKLRSAFVSPSLTKESLSSLMSKYVEDVKSGTHQVEGWASSPYGMSKLGIIAYSNVLARAEGEAISGVIVNSCCPGYTSTDMTSNSGMLTPEQGARTPFMLTQMKSLAEGGITGGFFERQAISTW